MCLSGTLVGDSRRPDFPSCGGTSDESMRIERTGKVLPLTPRLVEFLTNGLGGKNLDDEVSPEERRADYACLGGLLAVELKTLEGDASERMDNLTHDLRKREDFPLFYGEAPMSSVIKNMSDGDALHKKTLERIGRSIVTHLKKANDQLAAHAFRFPRKNLVRIMLLVNEDHEIYDPHTVSYIIWHELRRARNGAPRYGNIDGVIYMSERHATQHENRVAFPVLCIEGVGLLEATWKRAPLKRFMSGWADWNGHPLYAADDVKQFDAIEHVPDSMPRHDLWRLQYRREPYMQQLSKDALRDKFDETIFISNMSFLKGAPVKPSQDMMTANMARFTHVLLEMNERGIPVTDFGYSLERMIAAGKRLKAPASAFAFLEMLERERNRAA